MLSYFRTLLLTLTLSAVAINAQANLKLPAIIASHMVLQQKQTNPIWGWDKPGTKVTVTLGDQVKKAGLTRGLSMAGTGQRKTSMLRIHPMCSMNQPY